MSFEEGNINVIPLNDLFEHIESRTCPCRPTCEEQSNGKWLIIHNSFDGREYWESDGPFEKKIDG